MPQARFLCQFTPRERDVFCCLIQGQPNKLIARLLNMSEHTVEQHLQHMYARLNVSSRAEALRSYWEEVLKG